MVDFVIHASAEAEYEDALTWYLQRSARAAAGFASAFEKARQEVCRTPEAFPLCDDRHRWHRLRRYPFGLIYRVENDRVHVVGVPHDRQLPKEWSSRV